MKIQSTNGQQFSCAKSKITPRFVEGHECTQIGTINGENTVFHTSPGGGSAVVYFYNESQLYYFSDSVAALNVRCAFDQKLDFTITRAHTAAKPKSFMREAVKRVHIWFAGRSDELIANSPIAAAERNDCTVKALMEVYKCRYDVAHEMMRRYRRPGRGAHMALTLKTDAKFRQDFEEIKGLGRMTTAQFAQKHPQGRYVIIVKGHALALCDAKIYDYRYRPRATVYNAFKLREDNN